MLSQELAESKTKTDNLRKAMRFLDQMTPWTQTQSTKEVQLELNTWLKNLDRSKQGQFSPSPMLRALPQEMLDIVGCSTAVELKFSVWDVDYLYESRMMSRLARWITEAPLRDSLVASAIDIRSEGLSAEERLKLDNACKLFDWTMRNVSLDQTEAAVTELFSDPPLTLVDNGTGYGYLPWETLLFSFGDFIEKGRVFQALARQSGLTSAWVSFEQGGSRKIWAIAVQIGDDLLLFEPKLAMPVLNPDTGDFATLKEAMENERILRRLDLPGQFDYAINYGDLKAVELLLDAPPAAASVRMKMVEDSLLGDERMVLFDDLEAKKVSLQRSAPGLPVKLWPVPLLAQIHAMGVRERLLSLTEFTQTYMSVHGVWLMDNPASSGRLKHLAGDFENTMDSQGALKKYMEARVDDQSIARLEYNPDTQRELKLQRLPNEDMESYQIRIQYMQMILQRSKVDASYLMAQLHFDRGDYDSSATWFTKRVLDSPSPIAMQWHAPSRYVLGRIAQEKGDLEAATEHWTAEDSPQEAGNRLRLRYVRRALEPSEE